jgi:glycosyltransferase involved in cell wall biosynthesis
MPKRQESTLRTSTASERETVNSSTQPILAAVIPAFNEAKSISTVVEAVKRYALPIVVDDGSYDETARLAAQAGAVVVSHYRNQGYDAALQTGLFKAIELGCTFAITMDADGQHNPAGLEPFKAALLQGADLVIGVRDRHQRFSESLFAFTGRILWSIADPLCGMKGYRLSHIKRLGHFDSYTSIGTELAVRCARSHLRIDSVPVITRDRTGVSRFGAGLKPNYRILRALALGLFKAKAF